MPIKGLTDRGLAFPVIGQIRKGSPKRKNDKGQEIMGKDLTYFRVEFDEREVEAKHKFCARYGNEPTDIVIVLPFNEIDRMWEAWREAYTAGAMIHRCDGKVIQYEMNPRTNERRVVNGIGPNGVSVPCEGKAVYTYQDKSGRDKAIFCKPVGRLRVIVPELERLAYLTVKTTSIHDIINISEQLAALHAMNRGRLAGVPLVLRRRPVEVSTPTASGRVRMKKWLISIEADPEWVRAQLAYMHAHALPGNGSGLALPAPSQPPREGGPDWDTYEGDEGEGDDDVIDGEIVEETAGDAPAAQPAPVQQPTNGNSRPYQPERLRTRLAEMAGTKGARVASNSQRGLAASMLNKCFAGFSDAEQRRHSAQKYLFNIESFNDATDAQVLAALDWLAPKRDSGGDYEPDSAAIAEAKMAFHAYLLDAGQQELPLDVPAE